MAWCSLGGHEKYMHVNESQEVRSLVLIEQFYVGAENPGKEDEPGKK